MTSVIYGMESDFSSTGGSLSNPDEKSIQNGNLVPSLKSLAAREVASLIKSNYMKQFDSDFHGIRQKFDVVIDPTISSHIVCKLLKDYESHITAKNIRSGRLFEVQEVQHDPYEMPFCLALSPDGNQLVYSHQTSLYMGNVHTGQVSLLGENVRGTTALSFNDDGTKLAIGSGAGNIKIYTMADRSYQALDRSHDDKINVFLFDYDGESLASGSDDGSICLWSLQTGVLRQKFMIDDRNLRRRLPVHDIINFTEDGAILVQAGHRIAECGGDGKVALIAYSPCFDKVTNWERGYYIWNAAEEGSGEGIYDFHSNKVGQFESKVRYGACVSKDGSTLAVHQEDGIQVYHSPSLKELVSPLDILQAMYVYKKLTEQHASTASKVWSSVATTVYSLLNGVNYDDEQSKKEFFDGLRASLPEQFKWIKQE